MQTVQAVLFDLGDTLWHFPTLPAAEVWQERCTAGVAATLQRWGMAETVDCAALARAIREEDNQRTSEAYHSHLRSPHFPALVREVAAVHGLALSEEQAGALWYAWNVGGLFLGREIFPDSIPTLHALKRRGYRLGTVTNRSLGGPPFLEELRHHGMLDLFETIAVSCDDGWLKPSPRLFQKALDDLGVPAEHAVMVGDSPRADVAGAKALGMIAVWKRPPWLRPGSGATASPWGGGARLPAEDARLPDGALAVPDFTIDHPGELLHLPLFRDV